VPKPYWAEALEYLATKKGRIHLRYNHRWKATEVVVSMGSGVLQSSMSFVIDERDMVNDDRDRAEQQFVKAVLTLRRSAGDDPDYNRGNDQPDPPQVGSTPFSPT